MPKAIEKTVHWTKAAVCGRFLFIRTDANRLSEYQDELFGRTMEIFFLFFYFYDFLH